MFLTHPEIDVVIDGRDDKVAVRRMKSNAVVEIAEVATHTPKDMSRSGQKIALVSAWFQSRNTNKNEIVIWNIDAAEAELRQRDYLAYDVWFDATASKVLVNAYGKKTVCLDIASGEVTAQGNKELPLHRGALQSDSNRFWFASHKKRVASVFDFGSLTFAEHKLPSKDKLGTFKFTQQGALIFSDLSNVVRFCPTPESKPLWEIDMTARFGELGRCGTSAIFLTHDDRFAVVEGFFNDEHPFGMEYVIDVEQGDVVKTIEPFKNRGKLSASWSDTAVITYPGRLLNVVSGDVSEGC